VREVANQFLSNARLYSSVLSERLKCSSVLEEVTEVGSPFQLICQPGYVINSLTDHALLHVGPDNKRTLLHQFIIMYCGLVDEVLHQPHTL